MSELDAIDTDLGEAQFKNEEQFARKIAEAIADKIRRDPRPAIRGAHPKAHGCVRAEFRVEDDLPPELAQGVFQPGAAFPAWIRFSNGNPDPTRPDAEKDARGMAIKLLDVPGNKILPDERAAKTQDFVMINYPVFFADDPSHYLDLIKLAGASNPLAKLVQLTMAAAHMGPSIISVASLAKKMTSSQISSPLETRYWSQTPYRLGDPPHKQAIKYSARPRGPAKAAIPENPSPNFLRETMIKQLATAEMQFDFEVQPRTSPGMSVEKASVEWEESEAPFFKVATITIPRQTFATRERDQFGESLSFTPWHALPQHRPLGSVNRVRRVVYQTISTLRHELNGILRREPNAIDAGVGRSAAG
jgi:catalase